MRVNWATSPNSKNSAEMARGRVDTSGLYQKNTRPKVDTSGLFSQSDVALLRLIAILSDWPDRRLCYLVELLCYVVSDGFGYSKMS